MYRDYFETDVEIYPENEYLEELDDEEHIAVQGALNPKLYDFIDYTMVAGHSENYEDVIEDKIFKFKYRQNADDAETYDRRESRLIKRFRERAINRNPMIELRLANMMREQQEVFNLSTLILDMDKHQETALGDTGLYRSYMQEEAIQQYKDYYETDEEEQDFFQHLENIGGSDRFRMMEIFQDFTQDKTDKKMFRMISKREFNPELSVVQNMMLDLQDFQDRVLPQSQDIANLDMTMKYQAESMQELIDDEKEFLKVFKEANDEINQGIESTYDNYDQVIDGDNFDLQDTYQEFLFDENEEDMGDKVQDELEMYKDYDSVLNRIQEEQNYTGDYISFKDLKVSDKKGNDKLIADFEKIKKILQKSDDKDFSLSEQDPITHKNKNVDTQEDSKSESLDAQKSEKK